MGVCFNGSAYQGWQSQSSGQTVQDQLEKALAQFTTHKVSTLCAGRTDAGVHGLMQVIHFDTDLARDIASWVRGTNRYLPSDIAIQWAREVPPSFHCRGSAVARRYAYIVLESPVRPSLESGRVGWVYRPLNLQAMQAAAAHLIGEHDFSSFRASSCQALSPVKRLTQIAIHQHGPYWRLEFEGSAFLHHMIRNIMGCLVMVGQGRQPVAWMQQVLDARDRRAAAPTFAPQGLYFLGPRYAPHFAIPERMPAYDWLP